MTNNKKQTAVEWLIEQITLKKYPNGALLNLFIIDKLMEKAKAMEREQLKEMYLKGIENYDPTFKGGSDE